MRLCCWDVSTTVVLLLQNVALWISLSRVSCQNNLTGSPGLTSLCEWVSQFCSWDHQVAKVFPRMFITGQSYSTISCSGFMVLSHGPCFLWWLVRQSSYVCLSRPLKGPAIHNIGSVKGMDNAAHRIAYHNFLASFLSISISVVYCDIVLVSNGMWNLAPSWQGLFLYQLHLKCSSAYKILAASQSEFSSQIGIFRSACKHTKSWFLISNDKSNLFTIIDQIRR